MKDIGLARITGQANAGKQQFCQIATTDTVSLNFWGFTALSGDAVINTLTNDDGTSALGYILGGTKTAYQNTLYTGRFKTIKLTYGIVKLELNEQ